MWKATFRAHAPASGEVPEAHFAAPSAHGTWVWVDFEPSMGSSWCGCFRAGLSHRAARAMVTADGRNMFVVVGGIWYCIDAETKRLVCTSEDFGYSEVISIPGTPRVAIADFTTVTITSPEATIWVSPRIAWDGLRLTSASATTIVGIAETGHGSDGDRKFQIDLKALTVLGGYVRECISQNG